MNATAIPVWPPVPAADAPPPVGPPELGVPPEVYESVRARAEGRAPPALGSPFASAADELAWLFPLPAGGAVPEKQAASDHEGGRLESG